MAGNVRLWSEPVPEFPTEFVMTPEHLALLRHSYVMEELSGVEFGAAWIDPKRPYGNGDVTADILSILGWDESREDDARRIHGETPLALQIVLTTGEFRTGTYRQDKPYLARSWRRVDDLLGGI